MARTPAAGLLLVQAGAGGQALVVVSPPGGVEVPGEGTAEVTLEVTVR